MFSEGAKLYLQALLFYHHPFLIRIIALFSLFQYQLAANFKGDKGQHQPAIDDPAHPALSCQGNCHIHIRREQGNFPNLIPDCGNLINRLFYYPDPGQNLLDHPADQVINRKIQTAGLQRCAEKHFLCNTVALYLQKQHFILNTVKTAEGQISAQLPG